MGVLKWSDQEFNILKENYPSKNMDDLLSLLPNKTIKQIRSKAKLNKIKKEIRDKKSITLYSDEDSIQCINCNNSYLFKEGMFPTNSKGITHRSCVDCNNKKSRIHDYKKKYGIEMDFKSYFNTFDVLQWYRWTTSETTPNGRYINQIPRELMTKENIVTVCKHVIYNVLDFKTREQILNLNQPLMTKHKIGFSKTDFILNSPYNILTITFPELDIKPWELNHAPKDFWKEYSNFLQAVKDYFYLVSSGESESSAYFEQKVIEVTMPKLARAKDSYYNSLSWQKITDDAELNIDFKEDRKIAYDGTRLNSIQEKIIYEYIHLELNLTSLKSVGYSRKGKFIFKHNKGKYVPDFIIENENKKPVVIEYFGLAMNVDNLNNKNSTSYSILLDYQKRMRSKIEFFSNNGNIEFIPLFPNDLKQGLKGIKEKIRKI